MTQHDSTKLRTIQLNLLIGFNMTQHDSTQLSITQLNLLVCYYGIKFCDTRTYRGPHLK